MTPAPAVGDSAKGRKHHHRPSRCPRRRTVLHEAKKDGNPTWSSAHRSSCCEPPQTNYSYFFFFLSNFFLTKASDLTNQILAWCSPLFPSPGHDSDPNVSTTRIGHGIKALLLSVTQTGQVILIHPVFSDYGHLRSASQHLIVSYQTLVCVRQASAVGTLFLNI